MSGDVLERISAAEKREDWLNQRMVRLEEGLRHMREDLAEIKAIVEHLGAIADMGRGALWLALRLGGVAAGGAAIFEAVRIALKH